MITIQAHGTDSDVNGLSFNADGRFLASSASDGLVKVWAVDRFAEGTPIWADAPGDGKMFHLQFSPDGQLLFACGDGGLAWAWPRTGVGPGAGRFVGLRERPGLFDRRPVRDRRPPGSAPP